MVKVTGDWPSSGSVDPLELSTTVDPIICTGICADMVPAVAVMVAVRLILLAPGEKVTVTGAAPVPVVIVGSLKIPLSALKVATTPDTVAFAAFNATMVIVVEFKPSELTVGGSAKREKEVAGGVVEAVVPLPPPPQPASSVTLAANKNHAENPLIFLLKK